jgi:putative DNA methylase
VSGVKRKLIEVALPLEAINRESAREKSIRHGHPSTLHLWWARRPLAACRAVLFAQLVDDPSAHPDRFPTDEDQAKERRRLFDLIEKLVVWENTTDEALLKRAHAEIAACFDGKPPAVLDPFAGGGSIPLEAQRFGLEAHASDLNPVAVLINKALIEIPPKFAGQPPVFPGAAEEKLGDWPRATGLAEDVRRYGKWMRDEAEKRIGHLYPKAKLPDGTKASVIAWIWARAVRCPNPACIALTPLANSFTLCSRKNRPTHVLPKLDGSSITYAIEHAPQPTTTGTVSRSGARCLVCRSAIPLAYARGEGRAGRLQAELLTIVAEGTRQRVYLPPVPLHRESASVAPPSSVPDEDLPENPRAVTTPNYGLSTHASLYTPRQLHLLSALTELVPVAVQKAIDDGAEVDYANDLAVYLALWIGRVANRASSQCIWNATRETVEQVFARNALPMIWVYAEANPFSGSTGNALGQLGYLAEALERLPVNRGGVASQQDAVSLKGETGVVLATDPPYYDNVPYADLSDFFYVWHRRALAHILPDLYSTVVTPKTPELIAEPARAGSKEGANAFFEEGLGKFFRVALQAQDSRLPLSLFYAFKQAETDVDGTVSTGWETMLQALLDAGAMVVATWPLRTERAGGLRDFGRNSLASSVVLACRPRPEDSGATSRRAFLAALSEELPSALKDLQQGSIAPVDLAQAAIGPGMAIFSRYARVVEPDGSDMRVRMALALINQALDEVLSEQEGDFDADTRFCVKWFTQFGWDHGKTGTADTLSRAMVTTVGRLERGGIFWAKAGKARLLRPDELSAGWDPVTDDRVSVWEVVVRLAQELQTGGIEAAARLMAQAGQRMDLDTAKELAYLLFSICEKRRDAKSALLFNSLGTSWSDLSAAARTGGTLTPPPAPDQLDFDSLEE